MSRSSFSEVDFQPPSVMRRCAFASASTRASYFVTSSPTLREFLRGLREQREQLRKQIAGAVAQFADHQLVALIELPALDRACDHVGDRGQERHVVVAETAPPGRVRAEHAIGAAVAPGDRRGDRRCTTPCSRSSGSPVESGFGLQILDDHRAPGGERVAGLRIAARSRRVAVPTSPACQPTPARSSSSASPGISSRIFTNSTSRMSHDGRRRPR